jgi:DNA-binding beta-propeller fold protein YncE
MVRVKLLHLLYCILPLPVCQAIAADVSYVVLNRSDHNSLVRVSADGRSISTIAEHAGGYGLARDSAGNYIVAAVSSLLRVTPSGEVSTIVKAPRDSAWMCVVPDNEGAFVVVDNRQHAVWRLSADGRSIAKIANYSGNSEHWEDCGIILDESGNYLVLEDNRGTRLWRIIPSGPVMPVPLHGAIMASAGHIIADGEGSYFVASHRDHAVFRMNRAGDVTKLTDLDVAEKNLTGLARNPDTGEIVVTVNFAQSLIRISADGHTVSRLATDPSYLSYPTAVLSESQN